MAFLTNWVFWAIAVTIVILMAIIGYLAEGTELGTKQKKKSEEKESEEVEEISITEENNEPNAWTGEIKQDEHQEQVHDVPSINDWENIPTDTPEGEQEIIEEESQEENGESELFNEISPDSTTPNMEPINPQILENIDAPLEETIEHIEEDSNSVFEEIVSQPEENVLEPIEEITEELEQPQTEIVSQPEENVSEPIEEITEEQITEVIPESNNNVQEELIEPAPIFDAPVLESNPAQEPLEILEAPEEENKQETDAEDIWK